MPIVVAIIAAILRVLLAAYVLMIGVGVAHHAWLHALPTIGYTGAVGVAAVLFLVVAVFSTGSGKAGE